MTGYQSNQYNETVRLTIGKPFNVSILENPTTGYTWQVYGTPKIVTLVNSSYNSTRDNNSVGSGGVRTLQFQVTGIGSEDLKLLNARSWEVQQDIQNGVDVSQYIKLVIPITSVGKFLQYAILSISAMIIVNIY